MEEDHEELLQCTDDESLSETEEQCCPIEKSEDHYLPPLTFFLHSKLKFFICLILLILSTLSLLIVVPLYTSAINNKGNVYSLLIVNVFATCIIHLIIFGVMKLLCEKHKFAKLFRLPIKFWKLLQISAVYSLCCVIYIYSLDRNKVLCHLQDPIKGMVLVFALLYYFFFCRSFMGLHRIFSTTTVIVGLFVAIDYGLCDEFVCRGYDRKQINDDSGPWSWKMHSIWIALYIFGLTLFPAFYTLLDRHVIPEKEVINNQASSYFVNTISSSVTASTSNLIASQSRENQDTVTTQLPKHKSAVLFSLWIHIFIFCMILCLFWIDFIPGVGKGDTPSESFHYTLNGIVCHSTPGNEDCEDVFWFMLIFQLSYVLFAISSVEFLILSQSAVFTIATISYALPLVGVWWSLFYATPNGILVWAPKIRGEFVCSVIGVPIVTIGLRLLCKAHFEDYHRYFVAHTSRNQVA